MQEIIRHENYSFASKKNDIALLRIGTAIVFGPDVRPACLETDVHDLPLDVALNVTGWGTVSADSEFERFVRSCTNAQFQK